MKTVIFGSKFSISKAFGVIALTVAIGQAVVFGCATNGVHIDPRISSTVGVLTTALAWLSRSPFACVLGIDQKPDQPDCTTEDSKS